MEKTSVKKARGNKNEMINKALMSNELNFERFDKHIIPQHNPTHIIASM